MRARSLMASALMAPALLLTTVAAASAAPVQVGTISIGPELQTKLTKDYGVREAETLTSYARRTFERQLAGVEATAPTTVDIVILDATPNRPTFAQLSARPGLSLQSFGIGGAKFQATLRDGQQGAPRTVEYSWYENDIQDVLGATTWTDAERATRFFAGQVREVAALDTAARTN